MYKRRDASIKPISKHITTQGTQVYIIFTFTLASTALDHLSMSPT